VNEITTIILTAVAIFIVLVLGWWLLIASEGVYLGRRVVIYLYDRFAARYDGVKHFRRELEHRYLAQPLMTRIAPNRAPLILDIATGTGRLPTTMIRYAHFRGRVIGVDLSRRMLDYAVPKFVDEPRVLFMQSDAAHLPFPNDAFDVVVSLEALEFMVDQGAAFAELARVLKPGGLFLITNRINTRWMPRKTFSNDQLVDMLFALGLDEIEIEKWQLDYDRVWGLKPYDPTP